MKGLTEEQLRTIQKGLRAFTKTFGPVWIEKNAGEDVFLIYYPAASKRHIYSCQGIESVNGWLVGCVHGYRLGIDSIKQVCENKYEQAVESGLICI